ncbi:MBL fold metallo-hydrolase [Rubrimonas cliftonensis]|uniref:L-ascorbate metabolism protein UlaG, beta-lactamase superfamily n=1 Tax=Rubrimonas cliftonensis TaxID=89524 RepID=A0A1H3VYT4_9RHOB|nr:MBL fold metallo-hydrolase [Rubrimonas cliftonensis]SDZ79977.1 L-ascorbate metabolism protein UlaG, beta-lactamase superfamily [Rubrimonas cliftonensis]
MRNAAIALALTASLGAAPAFASNCLQVAWPEPSAPRVIPTSLGPEQVSIEFLGHAAFRIETPAGATAVTDFAGYWGGGDVPEIVTMNHAHSSHWTPSPDPRIANVLRGWNPEGGEAMHYLELDDLLVRNVPTDIRRWDGGVEPFGNSIFIFEAHGLCIGHLGHLHHKPTDLHYGMIGRLDVVMAPVDGGYTMNIPAMIDVLKRLRARVVIPMHWFGPSNLDRFLAGMADDFEVREAGGRSLTLSRETLPATPTVMVLR